PGDGCTPSTVARRWFYRAGSSGRRPAATNGDAGCAGIHEIPRNGPSTRAPGCPGSPAADPPIEAHRHATATNLTEAVHRLGGGGPGGGLVERLVRLSARVYSRGEKRSRTEQDGRSLAARLVRQAAESPGEAPSPRDEETAVTDALTARLLVLGDLDMDDVQAVRLGYRELARTLHLRAATRHLSADAALFLDSVTEWACLHIVNFFTQRSTFVARTLVEQSRDH